MKLAGTVVLYNPDKEVLENIQTYLPFLECLYVMDNSTKPVEFLDKIKRLDKVKYISLDGNKGIAKALKVATETAITDGFDFLLSMDDDSKFPTEDFHYVRDYLENNDISKLGIIAVNYPGYRVKPISKDKTNIVDMTDLITSGSFLNLKNYKKIDGYNENLFIDYVDNDICYQFKVKDYELKLFPNISLRHKLGNNLDFKFLWYRKKIIVHSPLRYYYMYRNYHYLKNHRDKDYLVFLKTKKHEFSLIYIVRRVILEKPHFEILKMIIRGIKDGKKGILGPYQERSKR